LTLVVEDCVARTADAIVVGAGIIGSSIALQLARAGLTVIVVDRAGGPGYGSTSASSAIVRFTYSTFAGVAAAWESKHCWDFWSDHLSFRDEAGLAEFVKTGMISLDAPIAPRERYTALFDRVGVGYEEWDPSELKRRLPQIDPGQHWPPKAVTSDEFFDPSTGALGGLYTPDAGYINDPQLAAHNLAMAAQSHGAVFVFGKPVVSVDPRQGRVAGVGLADGTRIDGPVVVNAAGPWSSALNRIAGIGADFAVGVRPLRQEVHHVAAPADYGDPGPAIADLDLGTYLRPSSHGNLLVGGTEPACDPLQWLEDPDDANELVTAAVFEAQVTRAALRLPGLRVPTSARGVVGVYDVADDWTPIYDRTGLDGFYVAIGTSGNQFKNAPLVGYFLSAIIQAVEGGHDHDNDPIHYSCPHTGNLIDLGAFSRRRRLNEDGSGTVMG
jgi:sarcosine oxidase, subunit beta